MSPTITISAAANTSKLSKSIYTRPQRKAKMSVTQTYFLAHSARGKLSREAARPDHDLRLLVGHANMLDSLMIDIANAEHEQEKWFNRSVLGADSESEDEEEEVVVQAYPATIVEEIETDWMAEETSDDDSEDEDDDLSLARTVSHHSPPELTTSDSDSDSDDDQMPPSPENSTIELAQKQRQALVTSSYYEVKETPVSEAGEEDSIYLASRSQPTIIAAY